MRSGVLKSWLENKGCRFDEHEHVRSNGHASLGVKLGERRSMLPLMGTHRDLDDKNVRRILDDLGLNAGQLPYHTEGTSGRRRPERHDRFLH